MRKTGQTSLPAWQVLMAILLVAQLLGYPFGAVAKSDGIQGNSEQAQAEHKPENEAKVDLAPVIAQSGKDEGDNRHPSGKDRSVEPGNSGNQGKSGSDPDGATNANGGQNQDKIGYTGGWDKADQDGNNGCGNDDDFEDDNNGRCLGKQPKPSATPTPKPTTTPTPTATPAPTATPTPHPTCTPTVTPTPCSSCSSCSCSCNSNCNNNSSTSKSEGSVLGSSLPKTGTTQTKAGWAMRVLALGMGNLAILFPSKRWKGVK